LPVTGWNYKSYSLALSALSIPCARSPHTLALVSRKASRRRFPLLHRWSADPSRNGKIRQILAPTAQASPESWLGLSPNQSELTCQNGYDLALLTQVRPLDSCVRPQPQRLFAIATSLVNPFISNFLRSVRLTGHHRNVHRPRFRCQLCRLPPVHLFRSHGSFRAIQFAILQRTAVHLIFRNLVYLVGLQH